MERHSYTIPDLAKKYSVTPQTIHRLIAQNSVVAVEVNGELRVWDPWEDPKSGTNTAEDLYILRGVEVAEILGITGRALRYLVAGGGMPGHESPGGQIGCVFVGRQRRYSVADVRRLIARRMEKKQIGRKGPRVRTAIVQWALERLATMDRIRPHRSGYDGGPIKGRRRKNEPSKLAAISSSSAGARTTRETRGEPDQTTQGN
jgi:hypothetical protein